MSKAATKHLATLAAALKKANEVGDDNAPPEAVDAVLGIIGGALNDLSRIADALEKIASAPEPK